MEFLCRWVERVKLILKHGSVKLATSDSLNWLLRKLSSLLQTFFFFCTLYMPGHFYKLADILDI